MYRLENSSATSKTTILLLQAQAIEKQNRIQTKAKHGIKKKKKKKKNTWNWWEAEQKQHKWTQIKLSIQENKNEDKMGEQTCCNPQYLHSNYS